MYTKVILFNLALGMLLLVREISNSETDTSNEAKILRRMWPLALAQTLQDLDLDATMSTITLAQVATDPNDFWSYAYQYPTDCAFLRRIVSCVTTDDRYSQIEKSTGQLAGATVIFTNEEQAMAEYISANLPLAALNQHAGMALAAKLAWLCSPLIVGKGAQKLKQELGQSYVLFKAEAQRMDRLENSNFESDYDSEFVRARTT